MSQLFLQCDNGGVGGQNIKCCPVQWIKTFEQTENFLQQEVFKLFIQSFFALEKKRDGYVPLQSSFHDPESKSQKVQHYSLFYDKTRLKLTHNYDEPYNFFITLLGPSTQIEFATGLCDEPLFQLVVDRSNVNSFLFVLERKQENHQKMLFCHARIFAHGPLFLQCIETFEQDIFSKDCTYSRNDGNVVYFHDINYRQRVEIVLTDELLLVVGINSYFNTRHLYCHDLRDDLRYFSFLHVNANIMAQECNFIKRHCYIKQRETKEIVHIDFDAKNAWK